MQSQFVLVDKNEGKSTAENPLDTNASARIVVPGYADPDVLEIRRDSPAACREDTVKVEKNSKRHSMEKTFRGKNPFLDFQTFLFMKYETSLFDEIK